MRIDRAGLDALLDQVASTQRIEIDCDELLVILPSYLERVRDRLPLSRAHAILERHLEICPECREEIEGLMDAIDATLL